MNEKFTDQNNHKGLKNIAYTVGGAVVAITVGGISLSGGQAFAEENKISPVDDNCRITKTSDFGEFEMYSGEKTNKPPIYIETYFDVQKKPGESVFSLRTGGKELTTEQIQKLEEISSYKFFDNRSGDEHLVKIKDVVDYLKMVGNILPGCSTSEMISIVETMLNEAIGSNKLSPEMKQQIIQQVKEYYKPEEDQSPQ